LVFFHKNYRSVQAGLRRDTRGLALCALAAAMLTVACGGPSAGPTAPTTQNRSSPRSVPPPRIARTRYVAFGDSLTAGTTAPLALTALGAGLPESYPFKLRALLEGRYTADTFTIENEGRPAELVQSGALRLPGVLTANHPEVVILLHGVNDIVVFGTSAVTRTAGYLDTMARDARSAGAEVVLCTLPPQRPGGFRAGDATALALYNDAIRQIAAREGATLVDFERNFGDVRLIGSDGLHPTEDGYTRMAQLVFEALRARYEIASP
jgi:lysophospholipase L1-like esterase